jgi:hypothetical protein
MLRQIADHVSRKCGSLFVEGEPLGQSGGVHIHDTLLNALPGALLIIVLRMIRRIMLEKRQA